MLGSSSDRVESTEQPELYKFPHHFSPGQLTWGFVSVSISNYCGLFSTPSLSAQRWSPFMKSSEIWLLPLRD